MIMPVLVHGADDNPDQWLDHPEILEQDIELMKKEGYKYSDTHFMLNHFDGFSDYVKICDGSGE